MKGTKVSIDLEKLHYASELTKALAHPLRLKILEFLDQNKNVNVNKIYRTLDLEQSITSQHLKILKDVDVLNCDKIGKYAKYSINYEILFKTERAVNKFLGKSTIVV